MPLNSGISLISNILFATQKACSKKKVKAGLLVPQNLSSNTNSHLCMNHTKLSLKISKTNLSNLGLLWVYLDRFYALIGWFFGRSATAWQEKSQTENNPFFFSTWYTVTHFQSKAYSFGLLLQKVRATLTLFKFQESMLYMVLFTQPLRSGRIWHKVNF